MSYKCSRLAATLLLVVGALAACASTSAAKDKIQLEIPGLSCGTSTQNSIWLNVCAGPTNGAPAGVSIEWALFDGVNYNHQAYSNTLCALSLSGQCTQSTTGGRWDMGPSACNAIQIYSNTLTDELGCGASEGGSACSADLLCDTEYIFWVKAHGNSDYSGTQFNDAVGVVCRTAPCQEGGCTLTWGYWKNHGPGDCQNGNNSNQWGASSLTIGGVSMGEAQLCSILHSSPGACGKGTGANATLILEHQLIAALLNKANGALDCAFANTAIADAQTELAGNETACVGVSSPTGQQMIATAGLLAAYNNDVCGSCPSSVNPVIDLERSTGVTRASWGNLKVIYR